MASLSGGRASGSGGVLLRPDGSLPFGGGDSNSCADADVVALAKKPTIWFVIDGSNQPFPGLDPDLDLDGDGVPDVDPLLSYEVEREGLVGVTGIADRFQDSVRFGLVYLDLSLTPAEHVEACGEDKYVAVPAGEGNLEQIRAAYPPNPPSELLVVQTSYVAMRVAAGLVEDTALEIAQASSLGPQAVIYSKGGGSQDTCPADIPPGRIDAPFNVQLRVELSEQYLDDAARRIAAAGAQIFAFGPSGASGSFASRVAAIGGTGVPYAVYEADALGDALEGIVAGLISCEIPLNGTVAAGEQCKGYVEVDGERLACEGADGWTLKDAQTLLLQGKACTDFKQNPGAKLKADFPCEVFVPLELRLGRTPNWQ